MGGIQGKYNKRKANIKNSNVPKTYKKIEMEELHDIEVQS
jgi:hypothetical protein